MESAVSMSFAGQGWGKERWSFFKASVRSVRHFLQFRWNRQFRCRSQGVEGLGKGALVLVYISLRRQYAALGTFPLAVTESAVLMKSAVSMWFAGR